MPHHHQHPGGYVYRAVTTVVRAVNTAIVAAHVDFPFLRVLVCPALAALVRLRRPSLFCTSPGQGGFWLGGPPRAHRSPAVLYIHGGGFVHHIATARLATGLLAEALAAVGVAAPRTFASDYPLLPEATSAAQRAAVRAAYDAASDGGARKVVVMGDSAGGALTLGLVLDLVEEGGAAAASLAGAVALSPYLDMDGVNPSVAENDANDWLPSALARRMGHLAADAKPWAQGLLGRVGAADAAGRLPPLLVVAGGGELLADDARALGAVRSVELRLWKGEPHDFMLSELVCRGGAVTMTAVWGQIGSFVAFALAARPADSPGSAAGPR